jgi:uncharacterized membrane protein YtjA (UPF0391 family)
MLRAAIAFFVIALLAMVLGANNVAGISMELGRTLLIVFVVLAIISFLISLAGGRRSGVLGLMLALGLGFTALHMPKAQAETAGAKVNDTANDAKTTTKKVARNTKRQVRDATGNHSATKDAKDSINNGADDVSNSAKKASNKVL